MYRVYSSPPIAGRHPVIPRDTAGRRVEIFQYIASPLF